MVITVASDCSSATLVSSVIDDLGPVGVKSSGTLSATDFADGDTVTIGAKTYTFQEVLTNVDGNVFITGDEAASQTLQVVGQPADDTTVTIDGKVYTFKTTLSNVDGYVQIGGTANETRNNLVGAITLLTGTPGVDYASATTEHPTVTASPASDPGGPSIYPAVLVTYKLPGTIGNGTAVSETVTGWQWSDTTLQGGTNDIEQTLINFYLGLTLGEGVGTGSGTAYAAAMTLHPTVEDKTLTASSITVQAKTSGVAGDSIATTETGDDLEWASGTLQGGVDEGTYTELDLVIEDSNGEEITITLVEADKTGDDYVVTPDDFGAAAIPEGFYIFTVTSTEPITTGTDSNCALIDCDLECEVYEAALNNLKRPSDVRTEYHLMYQSLLNVTECDSCDCEIHKEIYNILKRDINNQSLLLTDDCGCS